MRDCFHSFTQVIMTPSRTYCSSLPSSRFYILPLLCIYGTVGLGAI